MELKAKMKINCPVHTAYEAFCDPAKIGNFWFSTSSERWETGKTVFLEYEEYTAGFSIEILRAVQDREIAFDWGDGAYRRRCEIVFTQRDGYSLVEARESGWRADKDNLDEWLKNQTGWVYMLTCLKAYLENGVTTLRTGLEM